MSARHRLPRPGTTRRWLTVLTTSCLLAGVTSVAFAKFTSSGTDTGSVTSATLYSPGAVTTQYVEGSNNDGSIKLTWAPKAGTGTLFDQYLILRAAAASSPTFSQIGTTSATTAGCSDGVTNCTWTDNSTNDASSPPQFGSQYEYEIKGYSGSTPSTPASGGFTSGPTAAYTAMSLNPVSGSDSTNTASTWTQPSTSGQGTSAFAGIAAGDTAHAWAAGASTTKIASFVSGTWSNTQTHGDGQAITGVAAIDGSNAWTSGGSGKVNFTSNGGSTWNTATVSGSPSLTSVAAPSTSNIYVSEGKNVWHSTGGVSPSFGASAEFATTHGAFTALTALASSTDVWASEQAVNTGSNKGTWVLAWDGTTVRETQLFSASSGNPSVNAIFAASTSSVFAVLSNGTVEVCTASCLGTPSAATWTQQTLTGVTGASSDTFTGIWASDSSHVWIVGQNSSGNGVVVSGVFNGSSWTWTNITSTVMGTTTGQALSAITGIDANHIWVAGSGGFIAQFLPQAAHNLSGAESNAIATAADSSTYTTQTTWPNAALSSSTTSCPSQAVTVNFTGAAISGITVGRINAVVRMASDANVSDPSAKAQVLISGDGGSTWQGTSGGQAFTTDAAQHTQTFPLTTPWGALSSPNVQNISLCVFAATGGSGTVFKTVIDQVHVDVN